MKEKLNEGQLHLASDIRREKSLRGKIAVILWHKFSGDCNDAWREESCKADWRADAKEILREVRQFIRDNGSTW